MKQIYLPFFGESSYLSGAVEPSCGFFARLFAKSVNVCVCAKNSQAEALASAIKGFSQMYKQETQVCFLPEVPDDYSRTKRLFEIYCDRLSALNSFSQVDNKEIFTKDKKFIICTSAKSLFMECAKIENVNTNRVFLKNNCDYGFEKLKQNCAELLKYDNESLCQGPGQYAVRGSVIDIYPINYHAPIRVDFFGDQIDSIRLFDPTTQKSIEKLDSIDIVPSFSLQEEFSESIKEFLPKRSLQWIFLEPSVVENNSPKEIFYVQKNSPSLFEKLIEQRKDTFLGFFKIKDDFSIFGNLSDLESKQFDTQSLSSFNNMIEDGILDEYQSGIFNLEEFLAKLKELNDKNLKLFIIAKNKDFVKEYLSKKASFLKNYKILDDFYLEEGFSFLFPKDDLFFEKSFKAKGVSFILERDIFGRKNKALPAFNTRMLPQRTQTDQLLDFSELAIGDYMVHLLHGVCIYKGIKKPEEGSPELIILEFASGVILHLAFSKSDLLTRYIGVSRVHPKLGEIGSKSWIKTRIGAQKSAIDLASKLLESNAKRQLEKGFKFEQDSPMQTQFENEFEFIETADQIKAINDCKEDMQSQKPMDRLICGDVGFGKTEVAIRAILKAVLSGKQAAFLCPTTILCQQHYLNLKERFSSLPINVQMLSRFRKPSQKKQIISDAFSGKIDILVATHALFSDKLFFKDLGLLIIDEEHRFGVKHKEKIKFLRQNIDVISMSATPIPRTLQFALLGAKDLSVIETPPMDRKPIETIIKSHSPEIVKEAIGYEIARAGQVFYLHNKVQTIDYCAEKLQEMFPKLKIGVGHGQMGEKVLEKVMGDFIDGKYDILVCTTIIENGIDIANCNTIIVDYADRFGLSQLYQLRGRVGRSTRQAYAYLLLHKHSCVLDLARKRLMSIKQYNNPGAGFKIALKDLELRGAGNLLGAEQSGHIAGVGFDLYCSLLKQSVSRLKGEESALFINAQLSLDFLTSAIGNSKDKDKPNSPLLYNGYEVIKYAGLENVEIEKSYISAKYIPQSRHRIDFYRKIAIASSEEELEEIKLSLKDRFGKIPKETLFLLKSAYLRIICQNNGIISLETQGNILKCKDTKNNFIKIANQFPVLTSHKASDKLNEIINFIKNVKKSLGL